jgi:hypothetical protein
MTRRLVFASLVLISLVLASSVLAQMPPEMRAANEKIAANDLDGAIAILEDFTANNPQRGGALQLLARTYQQRGDVDASLRTWEKVRAFPGMRGTALVEIAALNAARKENDKAFSLLAEVRKSGSVDFDALAADPRFAPLYDDARFKALLPKPADFEKPFVEPVRVLYEIRG